MTRINTVDPVYLVDQHLLAEYREIPMIGAALRRSIKAANSRSDKLNIPSTYRMGAGHVSFFYDKLGYIDRRYKALIAELYSRGYDIDPASRDLNIAPYLSKYGNDWIPTQDAHILNSTRIKERILQKEHWYKYKGKKLHDSGIYAEVIFPINQIWR